MAETLQFDLVTPEKKVSSAVVDYVVIPGSEGDLMALPNHASCVTSIRPGIVTVVQAGKKQEYFVTGGFAEISAEGTIILAEQVVSKEELTQDLLNQFVREATEALEIVPESGKAVAAKRLNDFNSMVSMV
jgi:F-type H+-transporting ATPase subunit epsilon